MVYLYAVKIEPKAENKWKMKDVAQVLFDAGLITTTEFMRGRVAGDACEQRLDSSKIQCFRRTAKVATITRNFERWTRGETLQRPSLETHVEQVPRNATIIETEDPTIVKFLSRLPQIRSC